MKEINSTDQHHRCGVTGVNYLGDGKTKKLSIFRLISKGKKG